MFEQAQKAGPSLQKAKTSSIINKLEVALQQLFVWLT